MKLPPAITKGKLSVEEALERRRSRRDFRKGAITLPQFAQLLWSLQGCTGKWYQRSTPSAGATFPLEIFAAVGVGGVEGLVEGVYRYDCHNHEVTPLKKGDVRRELAAAALGQEWIAIAPVTIAVAADYARTTGRYGKRGVRYVHMEVGHAGENLYLQCESLGLGTVAIGAFDDGAVASVLGIKPPLEVLYLMPVGRV